MRVVGAAALAVILASVAATAACSTAITDGPLEMPTDGDATVCGPLPQYADAAFGVNLPDNPLTGVKIDDVEPVGADGVSLGGVYLMPVTPDLRLMLDTFPPVSQFPDAWSNATDAYGGTVATDTAVDLVVEVVTTGTDATLDGLDITYSVDGHRYRTRTHLALELRSAGCT